MSKNVTKMGQHGSGSPRPAKTALGCKISILAIPDRSGPVEKRPFVQSCSVWPKCRKMWPKWVGMGQGPLGLPKLPLVAEIQFWRFVTGPDLSRRGLLFRAALCSPNVEKCDQNWSAWVRVP